jgi:hypothetical protein
VAGHELDAVHYVALMTMGTNCLYDHSLDTTEVTAMSAALEWAVGLLNKDPLKDHPRRGYDDAIAVDGQLAIDLRQFWSNPCVRIGAIPLVSQVLNLDIPMGGN